MMQFLMSRLQASAISWSSFSACRNSRGLPIETAREHQDVAWCLHNMALLYAEQGQYEKADPLYERAGEIFKSPLFESTPTWPGACTTWHCSTTTKSNTRRPSSSLGGRWQFSKGPWARSTPMWD